MNLFSTFKKKNTFEHPMEPKGYIICFFATLCLATLYIDFATLFVFFLLSRSEKANSKTIGTKVEILY